MPTRTFQSRSQVVGCAFGAVVFGFIGLGGLLSESSLAGKVAIFILCGLIVTILLRYGQARMITTIEGVDVKNPFSRFSLRWADIESFQLGRSGINPRVCLIRLHDGKTKPALGVFLNNSGFGGGPKLVEELNRELHRSHRGDAVEG
jgi:hypothetical protein